ncbi:MAG: MlaD family protein [Verrucomicrobiota bacterium]
MKEDHSELWVGVFLLLGLALIAGLVLKFSNFGDSFQERYTVTVEFTDAGGVVRGSEVRLAGATIGKVAGPPKLKDEITGVTVEIRIQERFRVPKMAKVIVAKEGLVGDAYIAIEPPPILSGEFWNDGDLVKGEESTLDRIQENAQETLAKVTEALEDLDDAILKFNDNILGDENLERFDIAIVELTSAIKSLNEKVLGEENTENLKVTLENIRKTSENLSKSSEKLDPILASGQEAAEQLVPTIEDLREVVKNASGALEEISNSDGLLDALLRDEDLRADFEAFVKNLRERGVLRYKDVADESTAEGQPEESSRRGIFGRKRP